jgi:hypothetical protein
VPVGLGCSTYLRRLSQLTDPQGTPYGIEVIAPNGYDSVRPEFLRALDERAMVKMNKAEMSECLEKAVILMQGFRVKFLSKEPED